MANPKPMPTRGGTPGLDLAASFTVGSPIAQSIIASDLAECSDDEAIDDNSDDDLGHGPGAGPVLYKQPSGLAFDYRRPSMVNDIVEPALTREEIQRSRDAERSLLRDNHLLPPKHAYDGKRGVFSRLYRTIFSTKVRRPSPDEEVPRLAFGPSESSPLLPGTSGSVTPDTEHLNAQWDAAVAHGIIETTWQREARTIGTYAPPLILTFLLQYSINITSIFTVGRLGKLELGAVTLSTMTANIFCYAFFQGLATSLDTLCAQAYGSGHKHLVGLQLQRMTYFLWLLGIPIAVLFFFAGDILRHVVPEARSAELAGTYLRIVIFGIPGYAAFEGGKRFVQSQGLFTATTCVLLIAAPVNMFLNWLLVWHFGFGFVGAPIAVAFTQNLMPILLALYVVFVNGSQCWGGLSKRSFTNWGPMIRLAIPGMIMVVAEWLAFEILTLLSSQFGTAYLAAQSILVTVTGTMFMIPFPISIAASTRIANLIGAKLVKAARTSAQVAFFIGCIIGLFNLTLLWSLRFQLPHLFTRDEEVIEIVAKVLPLCAVLQIFDVLAAISHGLLRGIGKQSFGGYANLVAYYVVAVPISIVAAFVFDWKLLGLWFGTTIGLALVAMVEYWYCYTRDWEQSVREAERRNTAG
ncbi:putative mate efflux family protein [Rosellinia necatrix]|uniref:Putative mate efflux family protein n=1 Tax=Rosellinia necatrix TaxID=77044 RepID=A0A1W2TEC6_ROSNE|nr:putative mate efflux family protein [Rosellinia necatrix]